MARGETPVGTKREPLAVGSHGGGGRRTNFHIVMPSSNCSSPVTVRLKSHMNQSRVNIVDMCDICLKKNKHEKG